MPKWRMLLRRKLGMVRAARPCGLAASCGCTSPEVKLLARRSRAARLDSLHGDAGDGNSAGSEDSKSFNASAFQHVGLACWIEQRAAISCCCGGAGVRIFAPTTCNVSPAKVVQSCAKQGLPLHDATCVRGCSRQRVVHHSARWTKQAWDFTFKTEFPEVRVVVRVPHPKGSAPSEAVLERVDRERVARADREAGVGGAPWWCRAGAPVTSDMSMLYASSSPSSSAFTSWKTRNPVAVAVISPSVTSCKPRPRATSGQTFDDLKDCT